MMDDELRARKERLAETAEVESIMEEEQEKVEARCLDCGGELFRTLGEIKGYAGLVLQCRDCKAEY